MKLTASNVQGARGHVSAIVKACDSDDSVLYQDTVLLDLADQRRKFAIALAGKLDTRCAENTVEALEQQLLQLFLDVEATVTQTTGADDLLGALMSKLPPANARLLELAEHVDLFHDEAGEVFGAFTVGAHRETWPVESRGFRDWLVQRFYHQYQAAPNAQALKDALGALRARGRFDGPERRVHLRVAELHGAIYLDLCDAQWQCVEITAAGWRVVAEAPVSFRRAQSAYPLLPPIRGGSLDQLRQYVNLPDDTSWRLFVTWLLSTLRPTGPYVMLVLVGEQGAAKSTLLKVGRQLSDPAKTPVRSRPTEDRDVAIQAASNWWLAYDNLSQMPEWLSDLLCMVSTGGGFGTRALYTNDEEQLFDYMRPVALNAITALTLRGDFTDRALVLEVPNITKQTRRAERAFWAAFERERPALLGALLDALVVALANEGTVTPQELPRMADFALFGAQVAPAVGWTSDAFLTAYEEHREHANATVLEASPLVEPLRAVLTLDQYWEGTATALLVRLREVADADTKKHRDWPKDATRLSGELRRLAPVLRGEGIPIAFGYSKGGKTKLVFLGERPEPPEPDAPGTPRQSEDSAQGATSATLATLDREGPRRDAENGVVANVASLQNSDVRNGQSDVASDVTSAVHANGAARATANLASNVAANATNVAAETASDVTTPPKNGVVTPIFPGNVANVANVARNGSSSKYERVLSPPPPAIYEVVTEASRVAELLPELMQAHTLGLDTETTGLNPREGRVRLLQLSRDDHAYLFDAFRLGDAFAQLAPLFGDHGPALIGHNLAFDLSMLHTCGLPIPPGERLVDTQLITQLLIAGERHIQQACSLEDAAARTLGYTLDKTLQTSNWGGPLSDAQYAYAAQDATILAPLYRELAAGLCSAGLERVWTIERDCLPCMVWLQVTGAPFDSDAWAALGEQAQRDFIAAEAALNTEAGLPTQLDLAGKATNLMNWSSNDALWRLLVRRGHTLPPQDNGKAPSLDDEALLALEDASEPLAPLVRTYRDAARRTHTSGLDWLRHVAADGRVYAHYWQIGSVAGRMSCQHPNLQNVPRATAYRACFRAPEGKALVRADYSQVELRVAAEIAHEPRMLAAYKLGRNLHALTAERVRGLPEGSVTKDHPAYPLGKTLNLALIFGMGPTTLRARAAGDGVPLTELEARVFREKWLVTYKGIKAWHDRQPPNSETIDTRTLAGRRRRNVWSFTQKVNSPVQGTAADGFKAALGLLWQRRAQCPSARPVLLVHDEVVLECDATEVETTQAWLRTAVIDGLQPLLATVPADADVTSGPDWGHCQ